jgi:hypothetical protein
VEIDTGSAARDPDANPRLNTDTDTRAAAAETIRVVGMQNLSLLNGFFGRAFVWDAQHGARILRDVLVDEVGLGAELAGWELNTATCVSGDGRVLAGYGFAPSGEQAAWRATLPANEPPGVVICLGDGSGVACPCSNFGSEGRGCDNSAATGGARVDSSGVASLRRHALPLRRGRAVDSAQRRVPGHGRDRAGELRDGRAARAARGLCPSAVGGASTVPRRATVDLGASAALGDVIRAGDVRVDQVDSRDPDPRSVPADGPT